MAVAKVTTMIVQQLQYTTKQRGSGDTGTWWPQIYSWAKIQVKFSTNKQGSDVAWKSLQSAISIFEV